MDGVLQIPVWLEPLVQEALAATSNHAFERNTPFVIYGARVFQDGNTFCALLGDNIQEGICAFADTPANAVHAFNNVWYSPVVTKEDKE
jgi:hypothetical protein